MTHATLNVRRRSAPLAPTIQISFNSFSIAIYGDPTARSDDLLESIREHGILVPLVVAPAGAVGLGGPLRPSPLACARALGLARSPARSVRSSRPTPPPAPSSNTTVSAARRSAR